MQKPALTLLQETPYAFALPQAVQLIKHQAAQMGQRPFVRFSSCMLPAYQQSDIVDVVLEGANQWLLTCDLPSLSGSQGVMPRHLYIEALKEEFEQGNSALVDFFDGFSNRHYRLHSQTEIKHNLALQAEEEHFSWNRHDVALSQMLANLSGDLGNNSALSSRHLVQYSGVMGLKLSCLDTLRELLTDYFEYEFEVCYGEVEHQALLPCCVTKLGKSGQNNQLGFDALVGKSAVTAFQHLVVTVLPNNKEFTQIRNDEHLVDAIDGFIRHYMGADIKLKLMMKVCGRFLPGLQLSSKENTDIRLAQSTWLAPKQLKQHYVVMPLKQNRNTA
ncbi:hypothetical protein AB733_08990 [Photobacterium swingsii]|uniref:Type VI secretion system baseplate subunit TssG n=1 Tax=Photobacterium swingsii TaxID=680026 RepID=A0A0J8Y0E8_9GAMM|nr:type VI secretion system baseplate subunit TssG [Photobacterium swingsii]KMV31104.1 hypothetical protein AB733_08990 [Photobacterium swingsii]PSW23605.1 hypothetical protein C9I94_15940 [Photobacterium swingsii]